MFQGGRRWRVGPDSCRVGPSAPTAGWPPRRRHGGGGRHSHPGPHHPTLHWSTGAAYLNTFRCTALHSPSLQCIGNALRSENWAHHAKEAELQCSAQSGVYFFCPGNQCTADGLFTLGLSILGRVSK